MNSTKPIKVFGEVETWKSLTLAGLGIEKREKKK